MPAKIALAGEKTLTVYFRGSFEAWTSPRVETYQTDTAGNSSGKCA